MYIPSFALPISKTTCHAKPYLCCCFCCCCCCCYLIVLLLLHYVLLVGPARCFFLFLPTLLQKLHGDGCCCTEPSENFLVRSRCDYEKKHMSRDSKMCCCCCTVSAVVLRRPTKEYTHRYSMMHRRLTTAGIEVAPHYHQLLVIGGRERNKTRRIAATI